MILKITVYIFFLQANEWLPTTARTKQVVTPFTVKLQHEQTTEIKNSKIEITKKGVSIYYLKNRLLNHMNKTELSRGFKEHFHFFYKLNDTAWSVEITEPLNGLQENNSKRVTHILGLVSFARNTETKGPIVVMSRYI